MEEPYKPVTHPEPRIDGNTAENRPPDSPQPNNIQITLSKEKLFNGLIILEFILLVVMGWQLIGIKKQLNSGDVVIAKADSTVVVAPTPVAPPPGQPADIKIGDNENIKGGADAKVTIVEYSDFECPFCNRALPTIQQVLDTYGDDVRIVYRHFPLSSIHPYAQKAAEASECAADQDKFWEYHDAIFADQAGLKGGDTQLKAWAAELALNTSEFDNCLDSGEKASVVSSQLGGGGTLGVTGTPAFFINGVNLEGAQPFASFKTIIDQQLAA